MRALSPGHQSPVELSASGRSPSRVQAHSPVHNRMNSSDNYYEDVDPRFSELESPSAAQPAVPTLLLPGSRPGGGMMNQQQQMQLPPNQQHLDPMSSYESIQEGARSPAESDASNLTSVSRRGVNPEWAGQQQGQQHQGYGHAVPMSMGVGGVPNRQPMGAPPRQPQQDVLAGNPDFDIPGGQRDQGRMGGMI